MILHRNGRVPGCLSSARKMQKAIKTRHRDKFMAGVKPARNPARVQATRLNRGPNISHGIFPNHE